MTASDSTLVQISDLVHLEVGEYLPDHTCIDRVTSGFLPTSDGGEYVRTTVVLKDGHPKLDPRTLNQFYLMLHPTCTERGIDPPSIAYADKSELS